MLGGVQGQRDADIGHQIAGPHAAGDHHLLRVDLAEFGHHPGGATVFRQDLRDGDALQDLRAAHARASA